MYITLEFYKDNDNYCAYIGSDGGSGIECKGNTPEALTEDIKSYIVDFVYDIDKE